MPPNNKTRPRLIPLNRSVAAELASEGARNEQIDPSVGGWVGTDVVSRPARAQNDAVSRLEQRLGLREKATAGDGGVVGAELTLSIRRKIQFLEECDRCD